MTSKKQYSLLLLIYLIFYTYAHATTNEIAIINKIYPNDALENKDIEIIRTNECKNLQKFLLCDGDKIYFNNSKPIIDIIINYKEKKIITHELATDNYYTIAKTTNTFFDNTISLVREKMSFKKENLHIFSSNVRGDSDNELIVPFNTSDTTKMASGSRKLFVSWHGGIPPYTIIFKNDEKILFQSKQISTKNTITPEIIWPEGKIFFAVLQNGNTNLSNNTDTAWIDDSIYFANPSDRPKIPNEIERLDIDSELKQFLYIQWLASADNGDWLWDAISLSNDLGNSFLPAKAWTNYISQ